MVGTQEMTELRPMQKLMVDAMKTHAIREGEFTLASGKKSNWYLDGRQLTFRGDCIELVGQSIMEALEAKDRNLTNFDAVGGIVVGAIPVALAVASVSKKNSFAVRKEAKSHGAAGLIAGPLEPGQKVLIVEDTVTTGGSLLQSVDAVQDFGCEIVAVAALLDRGGVVEEKLQERGLTFVSVIGAPQVGHEYGS